MKRLNKMYKVLFLSSLLIFLPLQNVQSTQINPPKTLEEAQDEISGLYNKLAIYEEEYNTALELCKNFIQSQYIIGGADASSLELILAATNTENTELSYSYIKSIAKSNQELVKDILTISSQIEAVRQEISIQEEIVSILKLNQVEEERVLETFNLTQAETLSKIGWDFPLAFNFAPEYLAQETEIEEHSPAVENLISENFLWPCPDYAYVSDLWDSDGRHYGFDLAANYGTPIIASRDGVVNAVNSTDPWGGGWGYFILIEHDTTYSTRYAHCSSLIVDEGENVVAGDVIGYVGSTGNSTGNHLHFEIYENGERVDPLPFLEEINIS